MHTAHNVTEKDPNKVEIDYTNLYDLLGQLLSFNDATSENEIKRVANKQFIKRICYEWISNLYAVKAGELPAGVSTNAYDPIEDMGTVKG